MSAQSQHGIEHADALSTWCAGVERRAAGAEHAIARGLARRSKGTAAGAYRAEGRVQCSEQMDIWQCIAAADGATEGAPDEQQ